MKEFNSLDELIKDNPHWYQMDILLVISDCPENLKQKLITSPLPPGRSPSHAQGWCRSSHQPGWRLPLTMFAPRLPSFAA